MQQKKKKLEQWAHEKTYSFGKVVVHNDVTWESLVDGNRAVPGSDEAFTNRSLFRDVRFRIAILLLSQVLLVVALIALSFSAYSWEIMR